MNLLDGLGLDTDTDDAVEPVPVEDWTGAPQQRPSEIRAGDWFARAHDAGLPYDLLIETVARFSIHRVPVAPSTAPHSPRNRGRRSTQPTPAAPVHTLIALMRTDDETDREHLFRLGHQVRVFDLPAARPFFGPAERQSVFDDCDLDAAVMTPLVDSPFTVDRLALTTDPMTSTETLDRLTDDPADGVRIGAASHPNVSPAAALRLLVDTVGEVYAAAATNPAVSADAKREAVSRRGLSPVAEQAVLGVALKSKGSAARLRSVPRA